MSVLTGADFEVYCTIKSKYLLFFSARWVSVVRAVQV
jgi:hypothetical protein